MTSPTLRQSLSRLFLASAFTFGWFGTASAVEYSLADITINPKTKESSTRVVIPTGYDGPLLSAKDIRDGEFVKLNLRIILDKETENTVMKRLEQAFRSEPSGCSPDYFGPLEMEVGLQYYFDLTLLSQKPGADVEKVSGTIYPGERSTHWANDAFCEYDESLGEGYAVLRFSGYYFVIHRQTEGGTNIQLRPLTLTDSQVDSLTVDRSPPADKKQ